MLTPLPWWVGLVSVAGALGAALAAIVNYLPPKYAAIAASIAAVLAGLSHALTGANAPAAIKTTYPNIK